MQRLQLRRTRGDVLDPLVQADFVEHRRRLRRGGGQCLLKIRLALFVHKQAPDTAEEPVYTLDTLRVPRFHHLQRSHEHLIQPERIRAVFRKDVVRVDDVPPRLRHLLPIFTENQALVNQSMEGLRGGNVPEIEQDLVPEARVQQVQDGVFRTAHVKVHTRPRDQSRGIWALLAGTHPVGFGFTAAKAFVVLRVQVPQVIPATARPLRHGVRLALGPIGQVHPVLRTRQRRLPVRCWFIVFELGRHDRQRRFSQRLVSCTAIGTRFPQHREGLAPIPLPAEKPIAELKIHRLVAQPFCFQPSRHSPLCLGGRQPVERQLGVFGVHRYAIIHKPAPFHAFWRLHYLQDGEAEFPGECKIARVVPRHRHNCARAIADQHIICDPNGDLLARDWVDRVSARENSCLLLRQFGPFQIGLLADFRSVCLNLAALFGHGDDIHQPMLGCQHHVSRPEQCVRTRGEDPDFLRLTCHLEIHLGPFAAADPIPLHFLQRIAPVDGIQILQQPLRVRGDAQHPLPHGPSHYGKAANLALSIHDLFVGEHRAELFAPPNWRFAHISQPVRVAVIRSPCLEGRIRRADLWLQFGRVGECRNVLGLLRLGVKPRIVDLQENPLRPSEILRVRRVYLTRPIVAEAECLNLPLEGGDVGLGGLARMLAGFDRVLLRRQPKSIPSHWVEHVVAL